MADVVPIGPKGPDPALVKKVFPELAARTPPPNFEGYPGAHSLQWVDLGELANSDPPAPAWAVEGWIPPRGVTLVNAHGGGGKTVLLLQLGLCLAAGIDFLGLPTRRMKCALILAETSHPTLHRRLTRAADALGADLATLADDGWLRVLLADELRGGLPLFAREPQPDDRGRAWLPPVAAPTSAYHELCAALAADGIEAVCLDPATDFFDANEIDRRDVRAFIAALRALVPGPVVVSAHVNRDSARAPRTGMSWSGSTAWHNSARARIELSRPVPDEDETLPTTDDGQRLLHLCKQNDGRAGLQIEARLDFDRWLFVPTGTTTIDGGMLESIRRRTDAAWLVAFVAEACARGDPVHASERANRNPHSRVAARDDCPVSFRGRAGKRALAAAINRLRESGELAVEARKSAARNTVDVLVPGAAACAS